MLEDSHWPWASWLVDTHRKRQKVVTDVEAEVPPGVDPLNSWIDRLLELSRAALYLLPVQDAADNSDKESDYLNFHADGRLTGNSRNLLDMLDR